MNKKNSKKGRINSRHKEASSRREADNRRQKISLTTLFQVKTTVKQELKEINLDPVLECLIS